MNVEIGAEAQKSRMPGDPAHRKRVLREMSTQPRKILNF
jgi:hypothetical protein